MYNTDAKKLIQVKEKTKKKAALRYNEYYNIQSTFDNLYNQSQEGNKFKHLYDIIVSKENILLAYRTIKRNKGSKTPGTNNHNIKLWEEKNIDDYISYIQNRLQNYIPQPVRRVEIPKPNGKTRPLGIPCIEDRLIQQCIKQVLEPICEAKFYEHSYGFRPNRNAKHAIAYAIKKTNIDKCYFVVDVDIKGFFDNVDHGKLLKQLWTLGIQDKKLLSIISAMLKAEIKGEGIPTKGVPQGGILSPLLANVVLNELDWWVASQWHIFPTQHVYSDQSNKYKRLRKTALKEMFIVRYADDFKIYCRKPKDAQKAFMAVQQWLQDRLKLEISPEKSGITDLRKHATEFLGFQLKAFKNHKKWTIQTAMTEKAKDKAKQSIQEQIKYTLNHQTEINVQNLNLVIAGLHNYYNAATKVSQDFKEINYKLSKRLKNLKTMLGTNTGYKTSDYRKRCKGYVGQELFVLKVAVLPISYIKQSKPMVMNQTVCNYTKEGRKIIHTDLDGEHLGLLNYLLEHPLAKSVELNDNRISLYTAQQGKCAVTGKPLNERLRLHHITMVSKGGTDRYNNLVLVSSDIHTLIHAQQRSLIQFYLHRLKLSKKSLDKLNWYRLEVGNEMIMSA